MEIPLLSKDEVEKEGIIEVEKEGIVEVEKEGIVEVEKEGVIEDNEDIRSQIIELLKGKGYKHLPIDQEFLDETSDLFTKDEQLIQMTINDNIPEDVLERLAVGEVE